MAGRPKIEMEDRWYDVFSAWAKADRENAIKVLTALHRRLPDDAKPKAAKPKTKLDLREPQTIAGLLDGVPKSEAIS